MANKTSIYGKRSSKQKVEKTVSEERSKTETNSDKLQGDEPGSTEPSVTKTSNESILDQHKEFRDSSAANLEPVPGSDASIYTTPRSEKGYTTAHLGGKSGSVESTKDVAAIGETQSHTNIQPSSDQPTQPTTPSNLGDNNTFTATPPPPDPNEAPQQEPVSPEGPATDPPAPDGPGLLIPAGHAKQMVEQGINMLNYGLKNLGRKITDIKITEDIIKFDQYTNNQFHQVEFIKQKNDENADKLPLDSDDIALVTPPTVKWLETTGFQGMTPGQECAVAWGMVAAKTAGKFIQIKKEVNKVNEQIQQNISSVMEQIRQHSESKMKEAAAKNAAEGTNDTASKTE